MTATPIVVVATGISGSGRDDYLQKVRNFAANGQDKERPKKNIEVFQVGEMMLNKSEVLGRHVDKDKILNLSPGYLDSLRAVVFEEIASKIKSLNVDCFIVSTHACFRWKKHLMPAFDVHYLEVLRPIFYVTIVNDIADIRASHETTHWKNRLTLPELIMWRDEEIFLTKILANYQQKDHYIISAKQNPDVLYDLIFKGIKKAYISYPMTEVKGDERLKKRKDNFRAKLRARLVIFDPEDFEDTDLRHLTRPSNSHHVANFKGIEMKFAKHELDEAAKLRLDQTVLRDFRLIDQSDLVVVFWPKSSEEEMIATVGVVVEAYYGYTNNKRVIALYLGGENPFMKYFAETFRSENDLLNFLEKSKIF